MKILQLFTSEGHNFIGHHGRPPSDHRIVAHDTIQCVAGKGIIGDRFFDHKPDFKGQITFFANEVALLLFNHLQITKPDLSLFRRNVITEGTDLNQWIGNEFEIQGIRFFGTEECRPCYWMDQALKPGAEEFLKGRGGLRAKILTDGILRRQS